MAETNWHKNWKTNFANTEKKISKKNAAEMNRRADAIIGNYTLEFQNSPIDLTNVIHRTADHNEAGYTTQWILNCTNAFKVTLRSGGYALTFTGEPWRYKNFKHCDTIYLDHNNYIYEIVPANVKNGRIKVKTRQMKTAFIDAWKEKRVMKSAPKMKVMKSAPKMKQCDLYIKQRGAGCGKTYESIQILNDVKYSNIKTFIYLTKMHSAKDVIFGEFKQQLHSNKLDKVVAEIDGDEKKGKQYVVEYKNPVGMDCTMFIGTIDAYMMRYGDEKHNMGHYFGGIISSVAEAREVGKFGNAVNFGQKSVRLCNETMLIIDEAQDLPVTYINAIYRLMEATYCNVSIIGDKLQSISTMDNIFTRLANQLPPSCVKLHIEKGKNIVRRFHNDKFAEFVNNVVNYKKYDLPQIEQICNGECKEEHSVTHPQLFVVSESAVQKYVTKIIKYVRAEVAKHNYLPEDFMFIFPILSENTLSETLRAALQIFWVKKFGVKKYRNKISKKNSWWANWNDKRAIEYVVLHKSNEGKSINLDESAHATRIMSIHAAKGTGRNVVFVLGLNEKNLYKFTNGQKNLQYESLLHVALTRQKKSLYISYEPIKCDITRRFDGIDIALDPQKNLSKYIKISKIIDHNFEQNFVTFNKIFGIVKRRQTLNKNKENQIVDWGHHIIRYSVLVNNFYINLNKHMLRSIPQLYMICKSILSADIVETDKWPKYFKLIDKNKSQPAVVTLPILYYKSSENSDYHKYRVFLREIMESVRSKIKCKKMRPPVLCPLESLVFYYMLNIATYGDRSRVTISHVYRVICAFDNVYVPHTDHHNKCKCNKLFGGNKASGNKASGNKNGWQYNSFCQSIVKHYELLKRSNDIFKKYKQHLKGKCKDESFTYLINHKIYHKAANRNAATLKINNNVGLIGWSKNYVINIVFKPTFTKINFNETFVQLIYDQYLIMNCDARNTYDNKGKLRINNRTRFVNKSIIHCIVSLNHTEPIFIDINAEFAANKSKIDKIIKSDLISYYKAESQPIYNILNSVWEANNKKITGTEIKKKIVCAELSPQYIFDFIKRISYYKKNDRAKYKKIFENRTIFNAELKYFIKTYIEKSIKFC